MNKKNWFVLEKATRDTPRECQLCFKCNKALRTLEVRAVAAKLHWLVLL